MEGAAERDDAVEGGVRLLVERRIVVVEEARVQAHEAGLELQASVEVRAFPVEVLSGVDVGAGPQELVGAHDAQPPHLQGEVVALVDERESLELAVLRAQVVVHGPIREPGPPMERCRIENGVGAQAGGLGRVERDPVVLEVGSGLGLGPAVGGDEARVQGLHRRTHPQRPHLAGGGIRRGGRGEARAKKKGEREAHGSII
jgi:hypothetical protein